MAQHDKIRLARDPQWYKDAVIYELHVKSFLDGNDDGIGDFKGLISKLDYLANLGITAIWLLPFYPSPQKDDGYDISDYFGINPDYGTIADFKKFVQQAHARGIRIITELVINHTSDAHPWFQRSRRAEPGTAWRDFYVWSDSTNRYPQARIIFKDFERSNWTWDPVAEAYYWHRFYSHQPDLNFDNPRVQREILRVFDFWFKLGVDGVRLDAVPYLFERDGTNCENLPETHGFLKHLRNHVDQQESDLMLLAEANQWPEEAAAYFGQGDECHMAFHFPVMPRLFMAIRMEDRFPVIDILEQTPVIPDSCQWAIFLRNHDELTLEMVTDEERDYMYRVYARDARTRINLGIRRRLATLLDNDRRKIELLNILLLSLPGTPVIYYGDELGMGDNYYLGDRNGVRTPMQWSPDRNAGFSKASPHRLFLPVIADSEYHATAVNVENQESNPMSLLWWMRRAIAARKSYQAFGRGSLEFVACDNHKVLAFLRRYQDENILIVANMSGSSQPARLNLAAFASQEPEEIFSGNRFPAIDTEPYVLTLGPHEFYWFALLPAEVTAEATAAENVPDLGDKATLQGLIEGSQSRALEAVLKRYVRRARWFGGKGKRLRRVRVRSSTHLDAARLLVLEAFYVAADSELYFLPLSTASGLAAEELAHDNPQAVLARMGPDTIIHDAVYSETFRNALLALVARRRPRKQQATMYGEPGGFLGELMADQQLPLESRVLRAEQSNTAIIYADRIFMKLYRRLEEGTNPDLEITKYLTERTSFTNLPRFAGTIQWRIAARGEPVSLAMLQAFVPNQGDAWQYTIDSVSRYFNRAVTMQKDSRFELPESLLDIHLEELSEPISDLIGAVYLETARKLGKLTAEFHQAMGSLRDDPQVEPEPFTRLYQRSIYHSMRGLTRRVLRELNANLATLPEDDAAEAQAILDAEPQIVARQQAITDLEPAGMKIRIHGDYHLGQVLYTGKEFLIIDFEGEPARSLGERRLKRSPLNDVAGMIRSMHYAAYGAGVVTGAPRTENTAIIEAWADLWYRAVSGVFLTTYLKAMVGSSLIPDDREHLSVLLGALLLDKAVYELGYEINNRPQWLVIPVRGIQHILQASL